MKQHRLLVVDDEPHMIWLFKESFIEEYEITGAQKMEEALSALNAGKIDAIILDLKLNNENGVDVLKEIKRKYPSIPVIIITAYASIASAVETMKFGAVDYITKPFNIEEMRVLLRQVLQVSSPAAGSFDDATTGLSKNKIITESEEMFRVWNLIKKVAPTGANVLITGESGTGKELVARAIHYESPRRNKAFIAVNCAALPENLLESELFGYEEGAFTGARGRKPGKFELAHGGTLLLDEIGDMKLDTQVKILRVLEEKTVDRLGSTKSTPVDVRIIASTNKDLSYLVKKGEFREDLFFRLTVFPINIPPLRGRIKDIPVLANYFLEILSQKYGKKNLQGFHSPVLDCFSRYNWPGNVRELRNVVEQLVIMSEGNFIKIEDIPPSLTMLSSFILTSEETQEQNVNIKQNRNQAEVEAITDALARCGGNRTRAAKMLGISRRTLQLKIKKYNLT